MTLIEKEKFLNYWKSLTKLIPNGENNTLREHGSPMQDQNELWILLERLEKNPPLNTIIELGVCEGGGFKIWEQILPQNRNSLLIGVDFNPNILWDYKTSEINIQLVKGDTHSEETRNKVKNILTSYNTKADFLFIDAQHHARDVELDFIDYGNFVRDYGIIGFHDTRLMRSFWDRFTGNCEDSITGNEPSERAVFHKEEFKLSLGTGIFYKLPNQNVIKFKE